MLCSEDLEINLRIKFAILESCVPNNVIKIDHSW